MLGKTNISALASLGHPRGLQYRRRVGVNPEVQALYDSHVARVATDGGVIPDEPTLLTFLNELFIARGTFTDIQYIYFPEVLGYKTGGGLATTVYSINVDNDFKLNGSSGQTAPSVLNHITTYNGVTDKLVSDVVSNYDPPTTEYNVLNQLALTIGTQYYRASQGKYNVVYDGANGSAIYAGAYLQNKSILLKKKSLLTSIVNGLNSMLQFNVYTPTTGNAGSLTVQASQDNSICGRYATEASSSMNMDFHFSLVTLIEDSESEITKMQNLINKYNEIWTDSTNVFWSPETSGVTDFTGFDTVYVRTTGNDVTGEVNNVALPFLTIDAAITAVTEGIVDIGAGTFASPSQRDTDNLWLKGAGMPVVDDVNAPTQLSTGTILQGNVKLYAGNIKVSDLGVDCGSAFIGVGTPQNGLTLEGYGGAGSYTGISYNFDVINVVSLLKDQSVAYHAYLLQYISDVYINNIKSYYGVHGVAIKCLNVSAYNVETNGHETEGLIIKADSDCDYNTNNIYINGASYRDINASTADQNIYLLSVLNPMNNINVLNFDFDLGQILINDDFSKTTNILITDKDGIQVYPA